MFRRPAEVVTLPLWCLFILTDADKRVLCAVDVRGVTQLHDVVHVVCWESSSIVRFNATTLQRLPDINVKGLREPWDIAACQQTSQLYIPGNPGACIWRVSADGADIKRWWSKSESDTFKPWMLSVTSTRLLMTSCSTSKLMQLDAVGNELRRVQLPRYMEPHHAVESPTGTFIVSHKNTPQLDQYQVSEVNTWGEVLRHFSGFRLPILGWPSHVTVDSHGNILVADYGNRRILLLDAQLKLRRVIIDEHQLNDKKPWYLCYMEHTGQLLVAESRKRVAVFDVLRQ